LFLSFTAAFALLSLHWGILGVLNPSTEARHVIYLMRFAAFVVLIAGIVDKNRRQK
jgi:hypothetical protein